MDKIICSIILVICIIILLIYCKNIFFSKRNKVHFYVARDKNGELFLYLGKPFRGIERFHEYQNGCIITGDNNFYNFDLNKNDFDNLKWEDEPLEVFINMED